AVEAVGALPVGASLGLHLENPQIQAELDLRFAVVAADEAGVDLPRLVRPVLEDGSQVRTHALCLPSWHGEVLDPGPRSVRSYRACCLPPVAALGTPRTSSATLMARKISWIGLPS